MARTNPLYIRCAVCHKDITLEAQYIFDSQVFCGNCNEQEDLDDEYEEEQD
jgi:hypothetical protein